MAKLLYVVHRYFPYPGGSEYYVRDMAEESVRRGHDVTVLSHVNQGNINQVKVTDDYQILVREKFDLIIVHGGDVVSQDVVHRNAYQIGKVSPVLYMLILPSVSDTCLNGIHTHRYLGYSTLEDMDFIRENDLENKARRVRHGINMPTTRRKRPLPDNKTIFVSAGGYAPHKQMRMLAEIFDNVDRPNSELHLYGYSREDVPSSRRNVFVHVDSSKLEVEQAIADADVYVMNSNQEGFGLVLLEAMASKVPWIAPNIAGARLMSNYGTTFKSYDELAHQIANFKRNDAQVQSAYEYVVTNHMIQNTVDDIEDILGEQV
jgi:glycosyltransferase involved in cell wall biosynthesis